MMMPLLLQKISSKLKGILKAYLFKNITPVFIAMTLTLITSPTHAEITSAKNIRNVHTQIEAILKTHKPEDVLIAFDIDMTLTQPDHPAVYYPSLKKHVDIYKKIMGELTPEQKDLASTLTTQLSPQRVVEKETLHFIQALQEKGVAVIALTSSLAGQIKGYQETMIERRQKQLKDMGFDFSHSFNPISELVTFSHFKKYAGAYPMYFKGILSTNGEGEASKGDVLVAFLRMQELSYTPQVVVLIDDKKKHLETVEAALKVYDPAIHFLGIEYQGAFAYAPHEISREDFQAFWEDIASQTKL
jgi:hypothetical protein